MGFLFQRSEFIERIGRAKKEMARRGIDLLIVSSPANQFWLTGYDGWSFYTPQMVAVDGATGGADLDRPQDGRGRCQVHSVSQA